jgi:predicted acylesterase/phospholipase RssA
MKRALVLCGGGSLGSYEIGVWRYLREKNITFDIVTGTSIGALNGAIITTGEFDKAVTLWQSVAADKVISHGINFYNGMMRDFTKAKGAKIRLLAKDYFKHGGVDISPLLALLDKAIDPKKVLASPMEFATVCSTFPGFKEVDVDMKKLKEEDVMPWLLASSACFPIFPIRKIGDKRYVDGGYNNNLPIDLALKMGADEIVAVLLHAVPKMPQHPEYMDLPFVTTVRPSRDTGSIMDFDVEIENQNMQLGYNDAKKTYGECWGQAFTFEKDESLEPRFRDFVIRMAHLHLELLPRVQKSLTYLQKMPKTNQECYIRTIELMGQWLNINYLPIYKTDDFIALLMKEIRSNVSKPDIHQFIAKHNWGLVINKDERKNFLAYMDYVYVNNLKTDKLKRLSDLNPEVGAFMALCEQLKVQKRL